MATEQSNWQLVMLDARKAKQIAKFANYGLNRPEGLGQLQGGGPQRSRQQLNPMNAPALQQERPLPLPFGGPGIGDAAYIPPPLQVDLESAPAPQWAAESRGAPPQPGRMLDGAAIQPIRQVLGGRGVPPSDIPGALPPAPNLGVDPRWQVNAAGSVYYHPVTGTPANPQMVPPARTDMAEQPATWRAPLPAAQLQVSQLELEGRYRMEGQQQTPRVKPPVLDVSRGRPARAMR